MVNKGWVPVKEGGRQNSGEKDHFKIYSLGTSLQLGGRKNAEDNFFCLNSAN